MKNPKSQEKIDALLEAFTLYCEKTSLLEQSYRELKEEQKNLNGELEETNLDLQEKNNELEKLNLFLRTLLKSMVQGILLLDQEGTILLANESMARFAKKEESSLIGKKASDLFADNFFGFSIHEWLEKGSSGRFFRTTLENGQILESEPSRLESANFQGFLLVVRDTTEHRKKEELQAQAERLRELGQMAAQVAHEIRNPLGGIKGFAGLLERDLANSPSLKAMAKSISEATDELNHLVTQVLTYARPLEPHFSEVALLPLLEEIKSLITLDSNYKKKPKITLEVSPPGLSASLDRSLIKAALLNLAVNACQAMEKGGSLTLRAFFENNGLVFEVEDTGSGIPPTLHEKIFSPFYTTKANGSGLGLAETLKSVKVHGGTIQVKSEVEKGSLFRIKLPQTSNPN